MWWRIRFSNDADGAGVMITMMPTLRLLLWAAVLAPPILATSESFVGPGPAPDEKATDRSVPALTAHRPKPPA